MTVQAVVRSYLNYQAKQFSQSVAFREHLRMLFQQSSKGRESSVSNSEVHTMVLSLYIFICHYTNVISGAPPTKRDVKRYIQVADKNCDGSISFEECEVVALLLCEHCALCIASHRLVTRFFTPLASVTICLLIEFAIKCYFNANVPPIWWNMLGEKIFLLSVASVMNGILLPFFLAGLKWFFAEKPLKTRELRAPTTPGIIATESSSEEVSPSKHAPIGPRSSVYDKYEVTCQENSKRPFPKSPSASCVSSTVSSHSPYPISYAKFQFVSSENKSEPCPSSPSATPRQRTKKTRRSSAPAGELRTSLPCFPDSPPSSLSKTPSVFKKIRNTFKKKDIQST